MIKTSEIKSLSEVFWRFYMMLLTLATCTHVLNTGR